MDKINRRIKTEFCEDTYQALTDKNLLFEYKKCKSVKKEITKLSNVLDKYMENDMNQQITEDYLLELIPAGTKGVIRGNKFNQIVKKEIIELQLDDERFESCFEKKCAEQLTSEIPDWYILDKNTKRTLIGMNQLDLWGGGQQLNRGSKYIINNNHNNNNSKLLCVVCNPIQFTSEKNKAFNIFETGFKNNTLCYLKSLKRIIVTYFL
jgi:hypothetical protein